MKKIIIPFFICAFTISLFSCSEEKKSDETSLENDGMHITVNNDSTKADVNISSNGIQVRTEDGKEANVKVDASGNMDIKTTEGDASVKMDKSGNMDIKTKEGNTSVKMDKNGNMQIKGPDGKEINVNVKDAK